MKEQDKTPEDQLSEVETGNLPNKEFRVMIVKMIQELRKRKDAQSEKLQEHFSKEKIKQTIKQSWKIHWKKSIAEWMQQKNRSVSWKAEWWKSLSWNRIKNEKKRGQFKRPLWQHRKYQHLHYRSPRRRRQKGPEIIAENFSDMEKETVTQVQEVQSRSK